MKNCVHIADDTIEMAASRHEERCTRQCREEFSVRWRRAQRRVTVLTGPSCSSALCQRLLGLPSNASSLITGPLAEVIPFQHPRGRKAAPTHAPIRTLPLSHAHAHSHSHTPLTHNPQIPLSRACYVPYLTLLSSLSQISLESPTTGLSLNGVVVLSDPQPFGL